MKDIYWGYYGKSYRIFLHGEQVHSTTSKYERDMFIAELKTRLARMDKAQQPSVTPNSVMSALWYARTYVRDTVHHPEYTSPPDKVLTVLDKAIGDLQRGAQEEKKRVGEMPVDSKKDMPLWLDQWLATHSSPAGYEYIRWYLDNNEFEVIEVHSNQFEHSVIVDGKTIRIQKCYDLTAAIARENMTTARRLTSGDWIIDAREHIKEQLGVESPAAAIAELSKPSNKAADWILVELVASAMDKAYKEAKKDSEARTFYVVERYAPDPTDKRQFRQGWYIAGIYEAREDVPQEYLIQDEVTVIYRVKASDEEEASARFVEMSKEFWGESFTGYVNGQLIQEVKSD